jgi:hypothetical protein
VVVGEIAVKLGRVQDAIDRHVVQHQEQLMHSIGGRHLHAAEAHHTTPRIPSSSITFLLCRQVTWGNCGRTRRC